MGDSPEGRRPAGRRDVVVVGASAGGVEALRELVRDLPAGLPATVLVVLHLPSAAFSALPSILSRSGPLPAVSAEDGMPLEPGRVLVAPPDQHMIIRDGGVALGRGPKENGHRPAIDPLFRSAARWRGPRAVGVVLSGTLDDGAAGLVTIVQRGGAAVVQDPKAALYDGMPCAALRAVPDAAQASGTGLSRLVAQLCSEVPAADPPTPDSLLRIETDLALLGEEALADGERPGRPAAMTCPDCNGAMFRIDDGNVVRFRCRVGHAWSPESLLAEQSEAAEAALWAAIRSLEEKAALYRNLAARAERAGEEISARYHTERSGEADHSAGVLRRLLREGLPGSAAGTAREGPLRR